MLSTNPSIEQKINILELDQKGIDIYVKRDDLIHPFISGNKWRKLKYNYESYLKSGCKGIVTFGGAFSNHIIAVAAFCAQNRIESIGIIRGEKPEGNNHVLTLAQLWGMKLIFTSRNDYKEKEKISLHWQSKGYFIIPEGGDNAEGVKGCAETISELTQNYDHIFCASGTGCTLSGLIKGISNSKAKTKVHGVAVLKNGEFLKDKVMAYLPKATNFMVHTEMHHGGYAKVTDDLMRFMINFIGHTGIMLDPIYTGKLFYGIVDLAEKDFFNKGQKILAIHTGGLIGLLSDKMLSDVQKNII